MNEQEYKILSEKIEEVRESIIRSADAFIENVKQEALKYKIGKDIEF